MTLDLANLRKLAEMATSGPWLVELDGQNYPNIVCNQRDFDRYIVGCEGFYRCDGSDEANANLLAALRNNIDELLRLAEIGQTPMNQREAPHCGSCSCGTEPMLTTDTVPPEKRASICFECDPPAIVKDSDTGHCERVHYRNSKNTPVKDAAILELVNASRKLVASVDLNSWSANVAVAADEQIAYLTAVANHVEEVVLGDINKSSTPE